MNIPLRTSHNERGSVLTEAAVLIALLVLVLSAFIDFNMRLRERAAGSEALRESGRTASRYHAILAESSEPPRIASSIELTIQLAAYRRLSAYDIDSTDYDVNVDLVRFDHPRPSPFNSTGGTGDPDDASLIPMSSIPGVPTADNRPNNTALLRISVCGRQRTSDFFGLSRLLPVEQSTLVVIEVPNLDVPEIPTIPTVEELDAIC